jgi:hypothetical protein
MATPLAAAGEMLLMSITTASARTPSSTPSRPAMTVSTSGVSGSIVITTSEWRDVSGR